MKIKKSQKYYDRVRRVISGIAHALNALTWTNPPDKYLHQVLTANPLGGYSMAPTKDEGVVDPCGEVFDCTGLYVADGSVIPTAIGFHPVMTISAASERIAKTVVKSYS